jgi:hypothetical protein
VGELVHDLGPFSRQGSLNFWIEFVVWFAYILLVTFYIFKAIARLEAERSGQVLPAGQAVKPALA